MTHTHFIAVSADPHNQIAIYGIGHTAEEAIDDAVRGANLPSNEIEESERRDRDQYGDLIAVYHVAQPCTERLYSHVDTHGGASLSWGPNDAGLQDLIEG
jgi:hypothetical protein